MTQTLSPAATAHSATETAEADLLAREEARLDYLSGLALTDHRAYLAALTDAELASRAKWSRVCGEHWDADQFAAEIARRTA